MALANIQEIPPLDGNNYTGPTRMMSGVARTLIPTANTPYGEKMRWMYCGTAGHVSFVSWDGTTQVLNNLSAGVMHPIYSLMINSSGTTALNIVVGS